MAGASACLIASEVKPRGTPARPTLAAFRAHLPCSHPHLPLSPQIGGDTQSTEGTEASHKHTRDDLNCSRGYEWLVLKEAKLRNPAITTFGLSWGVPGWIGNGDYWSQDNIEYHTSWLDCARNTWGIEIDYMGVRIRGAGLGGCARRGASATAILRCLCHGGSHQARLPA